jgi:hypothetical protein
VTDLNPTLCDAWAAVVVTITILFLVGPLLTEIAKAYSRLSNDKLILAGKFAHCCIFAFLSCFLILNCNICVYMI